MPLLDEHLYPASPAKSQVLLEMILAGVDQETAATLTDGPDGWTTVEVVCHLRDFERIWQQRARMILAGDQAMLPSFPHEQMAIDNHYRNQQFADVWAERTALRAENLALLDSLSGDAWLRTGTHPEYGPLNLLELRLQLALHDLDHAEQLARMLGRTED